MINSIIEDQNYLWDHDRLGYNDENDTDLSLLPSIIKTQIISRYLFRDLFEKHVLFFKPKGRPLINKDDNFLADIALGLIPRCFRSANKNDSLMYEEN